MPDLFTRYSRQIAVPQIGEEGQRKLCRAKVLIIGCGALGSMVAMQLAVAGIKNLGIADYDNVDITNLQRQFFFKTDEAGLSKVELLSHRIQELNPDVKVVIYKDVINKIKAKEIFPDYDFIIDASDNPDTKKITGEISFEKDKPCCIGGVREFMGQVMTFLPLDSRFEDYFGNMGIEGFLPCSLSGVIGPAAVFCAAVQASEAIKFIVGTGSLLSGKLFLFNLLNDEFKVLSL